MSEFLTIGQAAAALGFTRKTVRIAIAAGRLEAFRLTPGGNWRIRRSALDSLRSA